MARRNNKTQTHVVANTGRQQGPITIERITVWQTLLGIVLPALAAVLSRLLLCLVFASLILIVGRQAGGLIALSVSLYVYLGTLLGRNVTQHKVVPLALVVALPLIALDLFGYWLTEIVDWTWREWQMYYSVWGSEFAPASSLLVTLRVFSAIVVPLVVWSPSRAVDWALGIEITLPKARETGASPMDIGSVPQPDGYDVQTARGAQARVDADESGTYYVPEPDVIGD